MGQIVVVVIFALVSCVLSSRPSTPDEILCNLNTPPWILERSKLRTCFNNVVHSHLFPNDPSPYCSKTSDFDKNITNYFDKVNEHCNVTFDSKRFTEFVDHSLKNDTFKVFYTDIDCVKKLETNLDQCVKENVGILNKTNEKKHSSWKTNILTLYNERTCRLAREVKHCAVNVLNACKPTTRQYVASLFDFSLKNCNDTSNNTHNQTGGAESIPVPLLSILISLTVLMI